MRIVTGHAKGARLKAPRQSGVRPTTSRVRGAIFAVLPPEIVEDARVLDLFAGSGALGIEALSRGALWADFVERDTRTASIIRENLHSAGLAEQAHVYCATAQKALGFLPGPYRLVLLDPPYGAPGVDALLARIASGDLLEADAMVVLEHAWRDGAPTAPTGLALAQTRRYGDTAVSLYHRHAGDPPRDDSPADAGDAPAP